MSNQIQVKGVPDEFKERLSALEKKIAEGLNGKTTPGSASRLREIAAKARAGVK